jgi:hypothetical protein
MGVGDQQQSHGPNLSARYGAPSRWWVLSDPSVDGLAKQIGVPGVTAVLLDQVTEQAAQVRMLSFL